MDFHCQVKETIVKRPNEPVPLHIRNAPSKLMRNLGSAKDYLYNPDEDHQTGEVNGYYLELAILWTTKLLFTSQELGQSYLPASLQGESFLPRSGNP